MASNINIIQNIFSYRALFVLYMIISANFLAQTFGCKVQYLLSQNMYAKHLVGFFTLFFFVMLVSPSDSDNDTENLYFYKLGVSCMLYMMFLLSTRIKGIYFAFFLSLIGCNYLLTTYADSLNEKKHSKKKKKLKKYAKHIGRLSIIVLVIGVIMYYKEKQIEYGKNFNIKDFVIGNTHCKNN